MTAPLPVRSLAELTAAAPLHADAGTEGIVATILADVQARGALAVREHAVRLGDLQEGAPLVLDRDALAAAARALPPDQLALLQRCRDRIDAFARAQRASIAPFELAVPGGLAAQRLDPVQRAGCYAPGGRHPLPSSVLMTAVTARAAGVTEVIVASPRPQAVTLAAAFVAGADALLCCGGAQAIGALAFGKGVPVCDVVVGPGNRFVTTAKRQVAGRCGVDLQAGPSELLVVADDSADPALVAADLLAQAEHDACARPFLVLWNASRLASAVQRELTAQLAALPTADTARAALQNGALVHCATETEVTAACDHLAPEHLQLLVRDPEALLERLSHYGAAFLGPRCGEVLGDYGMGPNHVLPTGGAARFTGGLSVLHFLRVRTVLRADGGPEFEALLRDAALLARLEGLEGHARAAEARAGW